MTRLHRSAQAPSWELNPAGFQNVMGYPIKKRTNLELLARQSGRVVACFSYVPALVRLKANTGEPESKSITSLGSKVSVTVGQ
jgi:hypothetical protein